MIHVTDGRIVPLASTFCARIRCAIPAGFINRGAFYRSAKEVIEGLESLKRDNVVLHFLFDNQRLYSALVRGLNWHHHSVHGFDPNVLDWDMPTVAVTLGMKYDKSLFPSICLSVEAEYPSNNLINMNGLIIDNRSPLVNLVRQISRVARSSSTAFQFHLTDSKEMIFVGLAPSERQDSLSYTYEVDIPEHHGDTKSKQIRILRRLPMTDDMCRRLWTMEYMEDSSTYPRDLVWPNPVEFKNKICYGYTLDRTVIGYVALDGAELSNVRVLPPYRYQGLAGTLVRHAIKRGATYLHCRRELVPWYSSFGFSVVSRSDPMFIRMEIAK